MKKLSHFATICLFPILILSGCTPAYEEFILEAEDGTRLVESKVFANNSIPEAQNRDIMLLAPQVVGDRFQIIEIKDISSTTLDFNIEGPSTDREILFDGVCGRMLVDDEREVGFSYAYLNFLDSGNVIKANRIFAVNVADCYEMITGKAKPEQSVTVEGLL